MIFAIHFNLIFELKAVNNEITSWGGKQLLQRPSGGCCPLHFNFFSSRYDSNDIWAVFCTNWSPMQWVHLPFGPC